LIASLKAIWTVEKVGNFVRMDYILA
jgi:hypothetical protein